MLSIGASGLTDYPHPIDPLKAEISHATDRRLFALYQFFKKGGSVEEAHSLSQIDPWFLYHIHHLAKWEKKLKSSPLNSSMLKESKKLGFSDKAIGKIKNLDTQKVRELRIKQGIIPCIKQIDTLAGEFDAKTNYLYLTYHGSSHDIQPSAQPPAIVLGSGPYCIGSSVEFDWCAVNTCRTLRKLGEETIIINSNPETVSTDYDESDRLYFEELTLERVQDIADFEHPKGIIVSVGGQIANNLAWALHQRDYPLFGTSALSIDTAENRQKILFVVEQAQSRSTRLANCDEPTER
jgi:carbamoyl-phosphate synthase large subunit